MKKIYFLVSFSIFFLVLVFLSSCKKEQLYNKLEGDWKLELIKDSIGNEIPLETLYYQGSHLVFDKCSFNSDMCPAKYYNANISIDLFYKLSDDLKSFNLYLISNTNTPNEFCTIVKLDKNTLIYTSLINNSTKYQFTYIKTKK